MRLGLAKRLPDASSRSRIFSMTVEAIPLGTIFGFDIADVAVTKVAAFLVFVGNGVTGGMGFEAAFGTVLCGGGKKKWQKRSNGCQKINDKKKNSNETKKECIKQNQKAPIVPDACGAIWLRWPLPPFPRRRRC